MFYKRKLVSLEYVNTNESGYSNNLNKSWALKYILIFLSAKK